MIKIRKNFLPENMVVRNRYWQGVSRFVTFFPILTFLICLAFGSVFYLLSVEINSLQAEKKYWAGVLSSEISLEKNIEIPTADNLPKIIEICQDCLATNEIEITSFNVERFSGIQESSDSGGLDYANLRMHFMGKWQEIETGLNELEHMDKQAIHVQEVILTPEGGEALLQIYLLNS
jgi:hypothetical protein